MARQAIMTVYNVELGLAVHIKAPNGKYIVIDLGTRTGAGTYFSPLRMRSRDIIGYMIITHPHLDHIDDILFFDGNPPTTIQRASSITNAEVLSGVRECDIPKFKKYCEINDRYAYPVTYSTDPSNPDNYGGLSIKTFSTNLCDKENFNNFSIIAVFELSGCKVVVCGDNEVESLEILMRRSAFRESARNADVLVAPHHGRESGYYDAFVSLVNPRVTIVSDTNKSDSSASSLYSAKSRGWTVVDSNGHSQTRKCLTTRNDGDIQVTFGESVTPGYSSLLGIRLLDH